MTCGTFPGIALVARAGAAGAGVAFVDSSTGGVDFSDDGEALGNGDFSGDRDFFGVGDSLEFFFLDLASAFRFDGVGDALAFFFFEGAGLFSSSDVVFFFLAVGVLLGFGVLFALFFFGDDVGLGEGDFSAAGDDFGFGVGSSSCARSNGNAPSTSATTMSKRGRNTATKKRFRPARRRVFLEPQCARVLDAGSRSTSRREAREDR